MGIYDKIFKPKKLVLSDGKVVEEKRTRTPLVLLLLLIATIISVRITGFSLNTILTRGNQFFVILGQMFPPKTGYLSSIWGPLLDTIKMSLLGSFIGGVLAIPFAILASSNLVKNKVVLGVVRIFLSIVRTIPTLVAALIATYIWGLGTMAGTVAIAVFTFAYVGKQLYELIEMLTWELTRRWKRWEPAGHRHFWQRSSRRCFRHTFPSACSVLREMSAMRQSWDM